MKFEPVKHQFGVENERGLYYFDNHMFVGDITYLNLLVLASDVLQKVWGKIDNDRHETRSY